MTPPRSRLLEIASPSMAALALCASLALHACGSSQPPTANETAATAAGGGAYLAFSPVVLSHAAKLAGEVPSTSRLVTPKKGAKLQIKEDGLKVVLRIKKHSVTEPVIVDMSLLGTRLSDLVVLFGPDDLQFETAATLSIQVDSDLIDISLTSLEAYHLYADGTATEANILKVKIKYSKTKGDDSDDEVKSVTIQIEVPGFSRYGVQNSN